VIKFVNKDGKLQFVLLDDDTQPREINDETKKLLKELGILIDDQSEENTDKTPAGISQDDMAYLEKEPANDK